MKNSGTEIAANPIRAPFLKFVRLGQWLLAVRTLRCYDDLANGLPPNLSWGTAMIHVKKILYPTDFSSYSNQAYLHAVALAETHKAQLTIVYVFAPGSDDTANGDRRFWRNQLEQIRPANPNIPVRHVFLDGDPATEIVRYAMDSTTDVIVLGTHGRTGVERLLMGSVAEKVMRDAPCSVLVVKLPKGVSTAAERTPAVAGV